jgi:putative membrane protein
MVVLFIPASHQEIDMRTNTILRTLVAVAAAAALLAAAPVQAQATARPDRGMGATPPATMSKADQKIVMDMAQGNMAEIEMAKMAQGKTQNEQVKTFAQQMIDDHTKALADVQKLASDRGLTMPAEVDKTHKTMADKLGAKSGDAFDKAYMAQGGVADHKKMRSMLAAAEKKAEDPEVKALVTKIAPTVDQHLKAAQQMGSRKGMAKGDKPPAGTAAGK